MNLHGRSLKYSYTFPNHESYYNIHNTSIKCNTYVLQIIMELLKYIPKRLDLMSTFAGWLLSVLLKDYFHDCRS